MIISKLKNGFGATVTGVDVDTLSQSHADELRYLLYENKILIIKDQSLTPREYIKFSNKIGTPVKFVDPDYQHPDYPEIFVSSNIKNKTKQIGMDRVGYYWHTDSSFLQNPLPITMLHAQIVPENGGETSFINMCEIFDNLPLTSKNLLRGKTARHEGKWRYIINANDVGLSILEVIERDEKLVPSAIHPVIIKHPHMKNNILYINEGFTKRILNLSYEESENMLSQIFECVNNNVNVYEHKWERGDLVIWDNRSVLHKAAPAVKGQDRMMYRIGVSDGQFYLPAENN